MFPWETTFWNVISKLSLLKTMVNLKFQERCYKPWDSSFASKQNTSPLAGYPQKFHKPIIFVPLFFFIFLSFSFIIIHILLNHVNLRRWKYGECNKICYFQQSFNCGNGKENLLMNFFPRTRLLELLFKTAPPGINIYHRFFFFFVSFLINWFNDVDFERLLIVPTTILSNCLFSP